MPIKIMTREEKNIKQLLKRESAIWDILEESLPKKTLKLIQELIYISEELTAEDGR